MGNLCGKKKIIHCVLTTNLDNNKDKLKQKYKNVYYNTKLIQLNKNLYLQKNSLLLLFEGNTYGLSSGFNEKPYKIIIKYENNKIQCSQNWYMIETDIIKPFL